MIIDSISIALPVVPVVDSHKPGIGFFMKSKAKMAMDGSSEQGIQFIYRLI